MPARAWVARSCLILGVTALGISLAAGIARVALNVFFQLYVRNTSTYP
jgi:hypothetical protein